MDINQLAGETGTDLGAVGARFGMSPDQTRQAMVAKHLMGRMGGGAGGGLGGMLGSVLGGGGGLGGGMGGPAPQAGPGAAGGGLGGMLGGLLDRDRDGNPLDDILGGMMGAKR